MGVSTIIMVLLSLHKKPASVGKEKREFCIKTVAMKDTDMILIIQKAETSY